LNNYKHHIFETTFSQLEENISNYPKYRYSQIINWVYKNFIFSPFEMINLPLKLREEISEKFIWEYPKLVQKQDTADKTSKYLLKLHDDEHIEFVLIDSIKRKTFCLSSQVGCPVQCYFCASGAYGLKRNLSAGEIVAQFLLGCHYLKKHPDNVVFMGIGEPFLNFTNLITSLNILCAPEYINYAARRITISTCGIPSGIIKLANLEKQWNLAVSLHAVDNDMRALLIPAKYNFPLQDIYDSCKYYYNKTGRMITLEYTLIKDINDKLKYADLLSKISFDLKAKINLIPYNSTEHSTFARPEQQACINFANRLTKNGANITFRLEKGNKINAACGQLRANIIKNSF